MRMSFRPVVVISAISALVLLVASACSDEKPKSASGTTDATATTSARAQTNATSVPFATNAATTNAVNSAQLVKQVRPSVVRVRVGSGGGLGAQGAGTGTGFFVDERGYIVTNNHVVTLGGSRTASSIKVDLADGRTLDATLVGRDERTDLAVLKVQGSGFTALRFASPNSIEVGEDVVAVGFALDLGGQPTVTKGVVSALDRTIDEQLDNGVAVSISGAIQTDAAINPGNSGGPLLDAEANVVGINTAGLRGGNGASVQGISFAVSSGVAQPIVKTLMEGGVVRRGYLGVTVSPVDANRAQALQIPVNEGARLESVERGGAAEKAGLRAGDVLVKVGDVEIKNVGDLTRALTQYTPGQPVKVQYYRGNQSSTVDVTPGERPAGT
ncbi:MAG: trypsin-like peptidase domain-containing protein [Chloroflexi bacterium]|nr:trypsin-like peptidase domain-containing protein [Chloroflexota bacterium]